MNCHNNLSFFYYALIVQISTQLKHIYQGRTRFKDRKLKWKTRQKKEGSFKLGAKYTFWSFNFSNYTLLIPKHLWHSILIPNFIFFIFCSWFEKWKRKLLNFSGKENKSQLRPILALKTSGFGVNGLLLMGKVYTRCLFSLKFA